MEERLVACESSAANAERLKAAIMLELDKQYVPNYLFREFQMRFEDALKAGLGSSGGMGPQQIQEAKEVIEKNKDRLAKAESLILKLQEDRANTP